MRTATASTTVARNAPAARVGRPRRVDAQAIVKAALEIGLERVTLKRVAERLGVAVPTLYRHVRSRDELMRTAAFQLALQRSLPDAAHAHWSELALRYAESLYEFFVAEPQLIAELLKGRIGPHTEVDLLEQFITALEPHGFTPAEAAQLFHALGMVTLGAAAGAIGLAASRAEDRPWAVEMRRTLEARDAEELPLVRQVIPSLLGVDFIPWLPVLRRLLEGIARARGEDLAAQASANPINPGVDLKAAPLAMRTRP